MGEPQRNKRFAEAYPTFPIWQVPLAKLKELPILQATLDQFKEDDKDFVQVPLAQISWYHHISLLSKVKSGLMPAFIAIRLKYRNRFAYLV